jgi:hypothetical protein
MPTDPAIKAALEKATFAADRAATFHRTTAGLCLLNPEEVAAAAVAAFLRALPDDRFGYENVGTDFEGAVIIAGCTDLHEIAEAVERAAQEARDA